MLSKIKDCNITKLALQEIDKFFNAFIAGIIFIFLFASFVSYFLYYRVVKFNNIKLAGDQAFFEILNTTHFVFKISIIIILIATMFLSMYVVLYEWTGKSKTSYTILTVPIQRYKILISKIAMCISFYIINIFSLIIISFIGIFITLNFQYQSSREYILRNIFFEAKIFDSNILIRYFLIALFLIGFCFMVAIAIKSQTIKSRISLAYAFAIAVLFLKANIYSINLEFLYVCLSFGILFFVFSFVMFNEIEA